MSKMRLAIVGAGPAGIYAADLLLKADRDFEVEIDLFEQLPAPYGLVRYGVSPDHPRIKGIITALRDVLDSGQIRFFGNVHYGRDITLEDLKRHYNAVIFSTGAIRDAGLDIPGIDAEASYGAADFVSWFDGHPDVPRTWPLEAAEVGVIGNGNVALDISRMLIKHADDLLPTEIPDNVYEGLKANPIQDLHLFGRRGPKYVKFTPLELRELGEVRDVDMIVSERDFDREDAYADEVLGKNKQITVITRIMNKWREEQRAREESGEHASRRLHMHFWSKPVEVVVEDGRVAGLKVERTAPDGEGGVIDTGEFEVIPMQALYRAVGYFGSPVDEIPFDDAKGVIPNAQGRVQDLSGQQIPGVYATGWIKRGPVGLIGHTKSDAMETLECLIEDRGTWWDPENADGEAVTALLHEREVPYTTLDGWHRLDEHELALGAEAGRTRVKVVPRDEMTRVSRGE
ncbi:pyridine nucleotide-disulfide oxidoreductase [Leucobacter luti]|uniref:Ferredoxin--NADP+ reductase n=1 Tax=Leucobacter luti TaxID=340320 RepID=A0A4Q7TPM1_9MICO|nr:pyridine nucleotide-disulfide oxidoreductase [Leucobacter luti]MBL3699950.1 pyridine nucleotide-disulfide oxidoreductase [Leucobacter luti]RZT62734.1 ferredoxin--NADP+ reductase [Leucobacter luti]